MPAISANLGFPRMGANRELKTALESFWKGKTSEADLLQTAQQIQEQNWKWQQESGIEQIPVGDFALYDHVLNTIELFGAAPARYQAVSWKSPLERYFAMARGTSLHGGLPAMEMTKWFNTNYHYIVPEWTTGQKFQLQPEPLLKEIERARNLGIQPRPVVIGPVTLLLLGKEKSDDLSLEETLNSLLPVYQELFQLLQKNNITHVQIDEPALSLDLEEVHSRWLKTAYEQISSAAPELNLVLTSYFNGIQDHLDLVFSLPVQTVHLDLVSAPDQLDSALAKVQPGQSLSLGLVNGRNIWKTDLNAAISLAEKAVNSLGKDRILISPSCSLLHSPIDLGCEQKLDPEVKSWLAFARQKLIEVSVITRAINAGNSAVKSALSENKADLDSRRNSQRVVSPAVRQRISEVTEEMYSRQTPFEKRDEIQQKHLNLPLLPTTTIGSFPQTGDVRKARADFRKGKISQQQYDEFLRDQTQTCVRWQEEVGIDVLVHGEFERNDMVEYFGEQLEGYVATENGWVQSYGSRCVKPPIIFGDVSRKGPMTVEWTKYAQSLTGKLMKGMLTGPVTILFWSFVRDDQTRAETCRQIALAIRDEVSDLESAGIKVIQIDEPAFREGLPLKRSEWQEYLEWAAGCFRLSSSSVADETQIHTHMCYSEFNDILPAIADMDADVISIETSRSQMELLDGFADFKYPNAIGPGVYDIHSPRVPGKDEVVQLIQKACHVVPAQRLWVNPDCGLKTRGWEEVRPALEIMVEAARELRETTKA